MNDMRAKWRHDCDKCRFLGGMFLPTGQTDWYVCQSAFSPTERTILARFSDEGSDYWSNDVRLLGGDHRTAIEWGTKNEGFIGMNILAEFMLKAKGEANE